MSFATSSKTLRATLEQVQHSQAFFVLAHTEKQWQPAFFVKPRLSVSDCVHKRHYKRNKFRKVTQTHIRHESDAVRKSSINAFILLLNVFSMLPFTSVIDTF